MPKWIEDRAAHIRSKNPDMPESQSWAIATQQSHKLGKTPKRYGTKEGRQMARAKYTKPRKEYLKKAAEELAIAKRANQQTGYAGAPSNTNSMQPNKMLPTPPPTAQGAVHALPGMAPNPVGSRPAPSPPPVMKVGADITAFTDELLSIMGHPPLDKEAGVLRGIGDTAEAVVREGIRGARSGAYQKYVYGGGAKRARKELGKQIEQRLPGLAARAKRARKSPTYQALSEELNRSGTRAHKAGLEAVGITS